MHHDVQKPTVAQIPYLKCRDFLLCWPQNQLVIIGSYDEKLLASLLLLPYYQPVPAHLPCTCHHTRWRRSRNHRLRCSKTKSKGPPDSREKAMWYALTHRRWCDRAGMVVGVDVQVVWLSKGECCRALFLNQSALSLAVMMILNIP